MADGLWPCGMQVIAINYNYQVSGINHQVSAN
jgi:hypothetical protein